MTDNWGIGGGRPVFVEPPGLEPLSDVPSDPIPPRPPEPDHWAGASPYLMGEAFYEPGSGLTDSDLSPTTILAPTPPPGLPIRYGYATHAPPMGGPQVPYTHAAAEHPRATAVLVLGVVGLVMPILSYIAWYLGGEARREIEAGAPYPWNGNLRTGYILGKVIGIISIIGAAFSALWFVLVAVLQIRLMSMLLGIR